jgi:hypothetical protein
MKNNDYIYYNQIDRFVGMSPEQVDDLLRLEEMREYFQWRKEFDKNLERVRIKAKDDIEKLEIPDWLVTPVDIKERIEIRVGSKSVFLSKDALHRGMNGITYNKW